MNKKLLIRAFALLAALSSTMGANAYDFAASGLYLNITGTNTVEVTYNDNNPSYASYSGNVTIPSTVTYQGTTYDVTTIGASAFRASTGLTGVTIPSSITRIGFFAFYECANLTSISIPYSVTVIQPDAFGKTGLTDVYIPNSVTDIGSEIFYYCTQLHSVYLPTSLTYIDMRSFEGCTNLYRIVIPEGVATIYSDAFKGCTNLNEVTLPRSTTTIKSGAFSGCTALTSLTCFAPTPPSLYNNNVFSSEAYNNATLNVPNAAKSAYQAADGWNLFSHINGLPYDFVLDNLKYVITSSRTVKCTGSVLDSPSGTWTIHDEALGYDVTEIGDNAFANCTGITALRIGSKVTSIASMAFASCSGITSMIIPNSVTYIGGLAFYNCTALESIELGENCRFDNSIGWSMNVFKGCTSLSSITCLSEQPWAFMEPMFEETTYNTAVLRVPKGTQAAYRATDYWYKFNKIIGIYTLDEALNVEGGNLQFSSGGEYPWIVMVSDDDVPYAQSGNAGVHNSTSVLYTTVTVQEGTEVKFNLQAKGEEGSRIFDECRFEVDGNEIFSFGVLQSDDWATNRTTLSAGTHTLTWSYTKDGSVNPVGDYFAIKAVELISPVIRGDVNGDNNVSIADVTVLIDYLLSGNTSGVNLQAADCNIDNNVSIADVTVLIDYLLSGSW